jgi:poly-gamma-glutamate synthase PgsB/CapB
MEPWALIPIGVYLLVKIVESLVHHRLLQRVPLRIHVNGTRGKSQTTELITYGLQAAGIEAMGKVTGSVPTLLHTDGRRTEIKRIAPTSIREQQWVVHQAVQEGAQVLVLECMAIKPELQRASERSMVRAP